MCSMLERKRTGQSEERSGGPAEGARTSSTLQSARPTTSGWTIQGLATPSIPKGGAAIRGMGEKLSANPATGSASLSIPIATPPGRSGYDLGLQISYDSGSGNGPFGLGFRLSVPSISRRTDRRIPRYVDDGDDADVFVMSGVEDLVPVVDASGAVAVAEKWGPGGAGPYRVVSYRPRTETEFSRIERWSRDAEDTHWRVTTRDNVIRVFGSRPENRVSDPSDDTRIFSWLLERSEDDRGNVVEYGYKAEDAARLDPTAGPELGRFRPEANSAGVATGNLVFVGGAQRYLKRIKYGISASTGDFSFEVVLDYGEHAAAAPTPEGTSLWDLRSDVFSSFRSGFDIRTYRLCRRVIVFHHIPELGADPYLVRDTELSYDDSRFAVHLISAVQKAFVRRAGGGYDEETLPRLDLRYTHPEISDTCEQLSDGATIGIEGGLHARADLWVDLDGEGIPGVLRADAAGWHYKRNLGDAQLAPPIQERSLPAESDLTAPGIQLQDLRGTGSLDLVVRGEGYYPRAADGTFCPQRRFQSVPNIDWNDANLRFLDIDGDGRPDVVVSEQDVFRWHPCLGGDGFAEARRVLKATDDALGPAIVFSDATESIHLADLSGDGLTDIVRVRHGEICYWPNLGHGRFGPRVVMSNAPRFDDPKSFDAGRVRFADLDGSGPSDLFYTSPDGVAIVRNEAGNGWSDPIWIRSLPQTGPLASLDTVDLFGTGTLCLVWTDRGAHGTRPFAFVDLLKGIKPDLLAAIDNNLGSVSEMTYAPSTAHYLRDRRNGVRWLTKLPFPVQCLSKVTYKDLIGRHELAREYRYHHGFYDGHEREFGGFACVEELDTETFEGVPAARTTPASTYSSGAVPPDLALKLATVRTVTWFHTGAFLEGPNLERQLRDDYSGGGTTNPLDWLLPDTDLPDDLSGREAREAARALRGKLLRQEVYSDEPTSEDSGDARKPYAISERSYMVSPVQRCGDKRHGVFLVTGAETIRIHAERRDDPRIEHELVLDVDEWGNVRKAARVAYPRRNPERLPEQRRGFVVLAENDVRNPQPGDVAYRVGVPTGSRSYELSGLDMTQERPVTRTELTSAMPTPLGYEQLTTIERRLRDRDSFDPSGAPLEQRLIEAERRLYWADDLGSVLPHGKVGARALQAETEKLALTEDQVARLYQGAVEPATLASLGYRKDAEGYWAPSGTLRYDAARFYLPTRADDPFGNVHTVSYDRHGLMVVRSTDPYDNVTEILLDPTTAPATLAGFESPYRTLLPTAMVDPNDNGIGLRYDAFGRVRAIVHAGKGEGDRWDHPSAEFEYALDEWSVDQKPPYMLAKVREKHGVPSSRLQIRYQFADGFGREIMTKVRAEAGLVPLRDSAGALRVSGGEFVRDWADERWVGTGRTVFDNKGNPVRKYEPYFSSTWQFEDEPELVETGVTPILRYDPLGRLIEALRPDGARSRTTFGAWSRTVWDENDSVLDSKWLDWHERPAASADERRAAALARAHAETPAVMHLDALGRPVVEIADNGVEGEYTTRTEVDVEGQPLRIIDPRGLVVLDSTPRIGGAEVRAISVDGRLLRSASPDAGVRTACFDVTGQIAFAWDARGIRSSTMFDKLRRAIRVFVQTPGEATPKLRIRTVYGDELDAASARAANLRTRVERVYDGAGVIVTPSYTLRGQPRLTDRRLALDPRGALDWSDLASEPTPADEATTAEPHLEAEIHTTRFEHDALDRVIRETSRDGSVTEVGFNQAGFIETIGVTVGGVKAPILLAAAYNARGQRIAADLGNGLRTEMDYDARTFRLARIATWTPSAADRAALRPDEPFPRPTDAKRYYQDLRYVFDPVGNIVALRSVARPPIIKGHSAITPDATFEYDAIYRLKKATGREHLGQVPSHLDPPAGSIPHANDMQALRAYTEQYEYDKGGNIRVQRHQGAIQWTLNYEYDGDGGPAPLSNRLVRTNHPNGMYTHDPNGNMTSMPEGLDALEWSWDDRLHGVTFVGGIAHYQYDVAGNRVRKLVEYAGNGPRVEHIYIGRSERRRRTLVGATATLDRLHAGDDVALALIEKRQGPAEVYFQLTNHLRSGTMEIAMDGEIVSYEEHTPWGRAAFHISRGRERRVRFNGKERDEETGLNYFGQRFYAAWLGRWTSSDPIFSNPFQAYSFVLNRPLVLVDPDGRQAVEPPTPVGPKIPHWNPPKVPLPPPPTAPGGGGRAAAAAAEAAAQEAPFLARALPWLSTALRWAGPLAFIFLEPERGPGRPSAEQSSAPELPTVPVEAPGPAESAPIAEPIAPPPIELPTNAQPPKLAPSALTPAPPVESPVATPPPQLAHGNSKTDPRPQHAYAITATIDGVTYVPKVGVSVTDLTKSGRSPRAERQISKLKLQDPTIKWDQVILADQVPGRHLVLELEEQFVRAFAEMGMIMPLQKRPMPW